MHPYHVYKSLLKKNGKQVMLGVHPGFATGFIADAVLCGNSSLVSSSTGGIAALQELIDLCAEKNIRSEIEVRPVSDLNEIFHRLDTNNDDGLRYVLDIEKTLTPEMVRVEQGRKHADLKPPTSKMTVCSVLKNCCGFFCLCRCF